MTRVLLVRHGESTWNGLGRYQGRLDAELSALGLRQSRALAAALRAVSLHAIYSSPLQRALKTAEAIAEGRDLPLHVEPDLVEIDHGAWSGLEREEVARGYPELYRLWREEPTRAAMPQGESILQVSERVVAAVNRLVEAHPQQTLLLCTHDAALRALVCSLLGLNLDRMWWLRLDSGSLSTVEYEGPEPRVIQLNDTCHLAEVASDLSRQAL